MAEPFLMALAGLTVRVEPLHDRIREQCRGYLLGGPDAGGPGREPDIDVRVTPAMVGHERRLATPGDWPDDYLETLAVHRAVAERLPAFDRIAFHGAAIAYAPGPEGEGRREPRMPQGLVFTAPSGTGKSTHIALWRRRFGADVQVINGDKPVLALDADGATVHATPWAGKEGWQTPRAQAPLTALCVVTRGDEDRCVRMDAGEAMPAILRQTYLPSDAETAGLTLGLVDRLLATVPVYRLTCGIRPEAVDAAATAMLGASTCPAGRP